MPNLAALYPFLKPLLFRLDPETAHTLTVKLMLVAHGLGLLRPAITRPLTPVHCLDQNFPNVLGLAAGMDKSASAVDAWNALGFGAVEVGTLTPRPQPGNPKPRLFRLPEHRALINRMGFNNPGIDSAVKRIAARKSKGIVGVNIGKNFDTPNEGAVNDYVIGLCAAYPVADYVAVNISSPNTKGLRDLQGEESMRALLGALKQEQDQLTAQYGKRVPIVVKIAPDLESLHIQALARVFNEMQVDGVIATNTTISRQAVVGHPLEKEAGGLSGAPVTQRSTEVISAFRELLLPEIPIIGVGGIMNGVDAKAKLQAGARLIQIYSGIVYAGPDLIRDVLETMEG
jgi:dihydroorotate dehydrogenase